MKLISLNVGRPRLLIYNGATINTGIFKRSVTGRIPLRTLNLDGDRQADLSVHGGLYKAVYGYPSEHYEYWRGELPDMSLPWGMFGENFTTAGLREDELHVGDRFRVGSAIVMIRQPRVKEKYNRTLLEKAIATPALPGSWREYFLPRLEDPSATASL
jgi:MOSC domain-containing protein YiiM